MDVLSESMVERPDGSESAQNLREGQSERRSHASRKLELSEDVLNAASAVEKEEQLSPRSLAKRVNLLIQTLTYTAFNFTRKGLFEQHKLTVSTILTFRILQRQGILDHAEIDHLLIGKMDPSPPPIPETLKIFITESSWALCKALEQLPPFHNFSASLEADLLQWKKWYNEEKTELADMPKAFKDLSSFHRLLLLRALRPDRLTSALLNFISEQMGELYIE